MTDFGFSPQSAEILSSRNVRDILRIEQTVAGILDSLLLFDRNLFIKENGYSLLKYLVKRIMIVGTYSVPTVIKQWKQFVNHCFTKATETVTEVKPKREVNNFFFRLYQWEKFNFNPGNLGREDLTDLSHLISTRQLPVGDYRVELKSLQDFKEITTASYSPDDSILDDIYNAARIIGRKTRKAGPGPINAAHISLAASGSLYHTVAEGGRAQEVIDNIKPVLTFIPLEDREITLPFTTLKDVKGVPRWRTWCRDEPYLEYPEYEFGEKTKETLVGFQVFFQGFDEAIGEQIPCCAYLSMKDDTTGESEIPLRVLTITEPGCKARIVTTGPYWLYVLQQCQAHVTRGFLSSHPSAEAGMMRTDQAWQYLYLIRNARLSFKDEFACLSSDLKSATDAIPHAIAVQLLQGFIDGIGYTSPLMDIAIRLLQSPRLCLLEKQGTTFLSSRGVFMGEPLAKTVLTLLNLSCEEIAIRKFLNVDFKTPIQVPWRCFSVAGDDHIAYGPLNYLNEITATHIRAGSLISPDKHGISRIAVRYCEKILDVRNFKNLQWDPKTINDSIESYLASPFIDSIKVRLLSPCSKSNESFNDRNTAVGKAKSLGNTLRWLHPSLFSKKYRQMIRDRFFQRMGPLLPDRSSGVFWHLLLPEKLGGLGLWMDEDLEDLPFKLPDPTKSYIRNLLDGKATTEQTNLIRGFTSNSSYRGYQLLETEVSLVEEYLIQELFFTLEAKPLEVIIEDKPYKDLSLKQQLSRLRGEGWMTKEQVRDSVLRPFLFKEILSREVKVSAFNTESFKKRYSKFWDIAFSGHCTVSVDELKRSFLIRDEELLYSVSGTLSIPVRGRIRECTIIDECTIGLPNLKIQWIQVGELSNPVNQTDFSYGEYV